MFFQENVKSRNGYIGKKNKKDEDFDEEFEDNSKTKNKKPIFIEDMLLLRVE